MNSLPPIERNAMDDLDLAFGLDTEEPTPKRVRRGFPCVYCGGSSHILTSVRNYCGHPYRYIRRQCYDCRKRFTTFEIPDSMRKGYEKLERLLSEWVQSKPYRGGDALCDHLAMPGSHAFKWPEDLPEDHPYHLDLMGERRNVWNPLVPICCKCGQSIGEVLGFGA